MSQTDTAPRQDAKDRRANRFYLRPVLKLVALVAIGFAAFRLPMPLVVLEPGPARDAAKLIQIDSPTHRSKGSYLLTTVLVTSTEGVSLPGAVQAIVDPHKELVARESIFPSDSTAANTERVHAAQMSESQKTAAVAALRELNIASIPDGAFVREVSPGSPAARKLWPGDVITEVDGVPVMNPQDLKNAVEKHPGGARVRVSVRRGRAQKQFDVKTVAAKSSTGKTRLGVLVVPSEKLPFEISIDAGNIGGPSAGLVFALAIYDALTSGDLTEGRKIAGTGTIVNAGNRYGRVGRVGAVSEKLPAAARQGVEIFLVPKADAAQAKKAAPEGMQVVGVSTLREAIRVLQR